MIVVEHLTKRYADREVVQDVSFHVKKGEILGFLGPNGAGKSTTMKMLTGYLTPSGGTVKIDGVDMATDPLKAKALIGYLPENPPLYPEMNVRDYLAFVGRLRGVESNRVKSAVEDAIAKCFLTEVPNKLIAHLSKGFQQRVGLAQAIISNPPVLVLDEPTNGMDPNQIVQIRELIKSFAKDHTVILSTHILPEVQATCERIVIINQGQIKANDTQDQLQARIQGRNEVRALVRGPKPAIVDRLGSLHDVTVEAEHDAHDREIVVVTLKMPVNKDLRERIAAEIIGAGWGLLELASHKLTLEEMFREVTTRDVASGDGTQKEVATHG